MEVTIKKAMTGAEKGKRTECGKQVQTAFHKMQRRKQVVSSMTFENFIKVNGEYRRQSDIPEKQMEELAVNLKRRFMESLGYVPVKEKTA